MRKGDKLDDIELDSEEQKIVRDFEADKFDSVLTSQRREEVRQAAINTFKKDKRIDIRISSRDLEALQRRALAEGMPYQTLIASVLHNYVAGQLRETPLYRIAE
ncbi:MAG: hypothetical protein M9928_22660 [Anaerolineae bacterium]|nr:hypothetical protein [Anaerolineae bacterium]MCO5191553.1 hypothetical protein [Anaerolineae bacterium]MCO5194854.1 hypothetical protein [Anaerolineae bacterium]MCO5207816.1 hypothetical protein [Anaerolineae bacterium]